MIKLELHCNLWTDVLNELNVRANTSDDDDYDFAWAINSKLLPRIGDRLDLEGLLCTQKGLKQFLESDEQVELLDTALDGSYRIVDIRLYCECVESDGIMYRDVETEMVDVFLEKIRDKVFSPHEHYSLRGPKPRNP
jgi:hypothetical protein